MYELDEKMKRMIREYIPHPRDPELEDGEYYVRDSANRVQRVFAGNILPHEDTVIYGLTHAITGKHVSGWYGYPPFDGVPKGSLYDNREDCRDCTHEGIDSWEHLREIEKELTKEENA